MLRIVFITVAFWSMAFAQPEQASVEPPASTTLLLSSAAEGSQIYTCTGGHWALKAPDASQSSSDGSSVPSLLLQAVPASGTGKFLNVAYIGRTDTHGGAAGSAPCTSGEKRVPYTAKYSFYTSKQ